MAFAIRPIAAFNRTFAFRTCADARAVKANLRQARRAFDDVRHSVEDFAADTGLRVRKHPLSAVALTAAIGATLGTMLGFAAGWASKPHA